MHIVQNVRDVDNRVILAGNCMLKVHSKNGENSQHDENEAFFIAFIVNCDYILPHLSNVTYFFETVICLPAPHQLFTCSNLTTETLENIEKYVQS